MISNLGYVKEIVSKTELKLKNALYKTEVIVTASEEYVTCMEFYLKEEELILIEYDLDTKIVNENPTI